MRQINGKQVACFLSFLSMVILLMTGSLCCVEQLPLGDFRSIVLVCTALISWFAYGILAYRLFHKIMPMPSGNIEMGSREEFIAQVNTCFHLAFYRILMRNSLLPLPLYSVLYRLFGMKIGANTYCAGYMMDPFLTEIGHDTLIGDGALVMSHSIQGSDFSLELVKIGNHVTVGARSVIFPGVRIEDHAVVATGAIVTRGTHIRSGEVWAGVPARCIKKPGITFAMEIKPEERCLP